VTALAVQAGPPLESEPSLVGSELTLGGFLEQVVARDPGHEAIVTPTARLTYGELREQARAVARGLVAEGAGKGSRVALLLPNGPQWVVAFFGCGIIGALPVAVNSLVGEDDLEYMLHHSDTQYLITSGTMLEPLEAGSLLARHPLLRPGATDERDVTLPAFIRAFDLDKPELTSAGEHISDQLIDALRAEVTPSDDGLIMFTSGSTGRPKAVLHAHRSVCIQSWRWPRLMAITADDRMWSTSPFFWTSGLVRTLGCVLAAGATLVMQEHFDAGEALATLARERVTAMLSRPHLDNRLLAHPDFDSFDLSALRRLEERSPLRLRLETDPWQASGYGMTESMTLISSNEPDEDRDTTEIGNGDVLCAMEVKIVDPDTSELVARETPGRICVRGITVMRGYYKVSREEVFDADGWFHTSDAGLLDEAGHLHWTGRLDDMAKISGVKVYPMEVERQLAHWGRLSAYTVLALPHPTQGAAMILCATLVGSDTEEPLDETTIREYLRSRLAGYQVPRSILLFDPADVTFTATQKVDLTHMRQQAIERMLADDAIDAEWSAYLREEQSAGRVPAS
jgi:fatty-acyl-CoA synthase